MASSMNFAAPKGHLTVVGFHAAERIQDMFHTKTLSEAADIADELWAESKRDVPAKDGAWWYVGPRAILCVKYFDGVPHLITVVPPTWTLLRDVRGKEHYWAVGPEEARKQTPQPVPKPVLGQPIVMELVAEAPKKIRKGRGPYKPSTAISEKQLAIVRLYLEQGVLPNNSVSTYWSIAKFFLNWTQSKPIREMALSFLNTRGTKPLTESRKEKK